MRIFFRSEDAYTGYLVYMLRPAHGKMVKPDHTLKGITPLKLATYKCGKANGTLFYHNYGIEYTHFTFPDMCTQLFGIIHGNIPEVECEQSKD